MEGSKSAFGSLLVAVAALWVVAGCGASRCPPFPRVPSGPVPVYQELIGDSSRPLALIGDTQRTWLPECLFQQREVNDRETPLLLHSIARAKPGLLVILGDLVVNASCQAHWRLFDHYMDPIRNAGIPVRPVLGNHDYWGPDLLARRNSLARFAGLRHRTYGQAVYGRLGLIWLNSNHSCLSGSEWERQKIWFAETLDHFDKRSDVDGVLVFAHHPPYTNSTFVSGDERVRSELVPDFLCARKTLAMITGHAHGYERFAVHSAAACDDRQDAGTAVRAFIVSGGGGGPRPSELRSEEETGWHDEYHGRAPRPFNFLLVHQDGRGVRVETCGMQRDESGVSLVDSVDIDFSPSRGSSAEEERRFPSGCR